MNCCTECFNDAQIQTMINADCEIGNCDFCSRKNVPIYCVDKQSDLSDLISEVLSMYEETDVGEPLFSLVINDWGIFKKELASSSDLIAAFCATIYGDGGYAHNKSVHIPHDYIEKYGIFSGHSWGEFCDVIKTKNRFCNGYCKTSETE